MSNVPDLNNRQEILKCVVVGDTAVGKTRLICARACNVFLTLPQMLATHVPTVWAIDQYRIHKEVLKQSWMIVDGVPVSLRLWDTFGDHDKDRKFAYGRADVVLLCYSVSNHQSLKNCKTKWYPEIRQNCPDTPILLVGCKNDLRHIYRDEDFLQLCRERNPFARTIQESDMVTREQGRLIAMEIGAVYYETSVFTKYGVMDVFENATRVALIARRPQMFWMKSFKNVQEPKLQKPYCPPEPNVPEIHVPDSTFQGDLFSLLAKEYEPDIKVVAGGKVFHAHKIILSSASSYFHRIFISLSELKSRNVDKNETLNIFQRFSSNAVSTFLRFLYSGGIGNPTRTELAELRDIATVTNISALQDLIQSRGENEEHLQIEIRREYMRNMSKHLKQNCLQSHLFADVVFQVDNGQCYAHRCLLMVRCAVMAAMFGGDFRESSADVIPFPGVSMETFHQFLFYLYADRVDASIDVQNCLPLIELANRLCLPHFTSLIEKHISEQLNEMKRKGHDLVESLFHLIEPCQLHNAYQLADWCQYYIITNYVDISTKYPKLLRSLHPDNQAFLNKNRWPPAHYLKELGYYERCVRESEQKRRPRKGLLWNPAKKEADRYLSSENKNSSCQRSKKTYLLNLF